MRFEPPNSSIASISSMSNNITPLRFKINLDAAKEFLSLLDPLQEDFTFQIYDDAKKGRPLSKIIHGWFDDKAKALTELNSNGVAIAVCINKTDLQGRENRNITRVRAI
jgi:hypothetical protein